MSVLNTMLGDLERRGHASPLSLAPREETHASAPPSAPLILVSARSKRPVGLALLLAAVSAAAVAVWLWPRPVPAPANPPSPALADATARPPSAPLPATAEAAPPRSELPPLAVERIAPPTLAPQATADLPAAARLPDQASGAAARDAKEGSAEAGLPQPVAGPASVLPTLPHTPTPRVGSAPGSARSATAASQMGASGTAAAETNAGAGSEPAVAQSAGQADLTRAMDLVARGRATEAMQMLSAALSQRPAWHEARSALAALQAEGGDRQQALATLLGGVALDPNRFAPLAAQLQAELNDAAGALRTLDRVPTESRDQSYHALAGAIAQRAGQHETAVAEYSAALRVARSNSLAWVGLAVSLQALGRDAQALAAYQAAAGGRLSPEMHRFVQARISAAQASAQPAAAQVR